MKLEKKTVVNVKYPVHVNSYDESFLRSFSELKISYSKKCTSFQNLWVTVSHSQQEYTSSFHFLLSSELPDLLPDCQALPNIQLTKLSQTDERIPFPSTAAVLIIE